MRNRAWWGGVLAVLAGCTPTTPVPVTAPPPGIVPAEVGFPPVGTQWVMRSTDHTTGVPVEVTWSTLGHGTYRGQPVFQLRAGIDIQLYDPTTRSLMAVVRDNKPRWEYWPHFGDSSSPLWVGKTWVARFGLWNYELGMRWPDLTISWKVVAYEDVTVPAGTFKAFKLEGSNLWVRITKWYAPEEKLIVKSVLERLRNNYLGPGGETSELLEYPAREPSPR